MALFDISVPLHPGLPVWPGDPPLRIEQPLALERGDPATVSFLKLGAHTGTHVDAFSHFKPGGRTLEAMDLAVYTGQARVIEIDHPEKITREALEALDLAGVSRVLFKTRNSSRPWHAEPFNPNFVYLDAVAAVYLVSLGVRLVGTDYLSVEGFHVAGAPTHHALMDGGVYIVEGLYLADVPPGDYELICLPLSVAGADGAPARVVLRATP